MSLSSDVLTVRGGAERMLAGCESVQVADEEEVIEKANGFVPEGEQRDVFGDGKAGESIKEVIGGLR